MPQASWWPQLLPTPGLWWGGILGEPLCNPAEHHQEADAHWTVAHHFSLNVFLWQSGWFSLTWLHDLTMSQGPSIPGAHPSTETTLWEQLTTNPIKLQGWDSQLPARLHVLPENPTQSSGFAETAVKKLGAKWLGRNQCLRRVCSPKSLGGTSVISKLQACVQACLAYSYSYQQHENHLSNRSEHC